MPVESVARLMLQWCRISVRKVGISSNQTLVLSATGNLLRHDIATQQEKGKTLSVQANYLPLFMLMAQE
jgi:hypothetical protein